MFSGRCFSVTMTHNHRVHPTASAPPSEQGCTGDGCAPAAGDAERWADKAGLRKASRDSLGTS